MDEAGEVGEAAGDGAVEAVAGEVEVAERGEVADGGGQAAGEGVAGEGEVLQRAHAGERGELELPGEAEPVEREADDRAAVADHAAPAGGARVPAAAGVGRVRRGPGSQHGALVPVRDALLELEQRGHVVAGGAGAEKKQKDENLEHGHGCGLRRRAGARVRVGRRSRRRRWRPLESLCVRVREGRG